MSAKNIVSMVQSIISMLTADLEGLIASYVNMRTKNDKMKQKIIQYYPSLANVYKIEQDALTILSTLAISRIFDGGPGDDTSDKASVWRLAALLKKKEVQEEIKKEMSWEGFDDQFLMRVGFLKDGKVMNDKKEGIVFDEKYINAFVNFMESFASDNDKKKRLLRIRYLRNRSLAHSLTNVKKNEDPDYLDLDILFRASLNSVGLAFQAVLGKMPVFDGFIENYRQDTIRYAECFLNES